MAATIIPVTVAVTGIAYDAMLGGSVAVGGGDISRQLSLSCIGTTAAPTAGAIVTAAYNGTTVFTGPITTLSRSGRIFDLTAEDKGHFGLDPYAVVTPFTIAAGTSLGAACNTIATHMGLTTSASDALTLKKPLSVERGAAPWRVIKDLCFAANRLVFFKRDGALTIRRKRASGAAADWTVSDTTALLSEPKVSWDTAGYRTAVQVIGNQTCGDVFYAYAGSTTAPVALESIDTEDVDDQAGVDALAAEALADADVVEVGADFSAIPNASLEVFDKVSVGGQTFIVDTFTIPLNGTGAMSVGAHKMVHRAGWKGYR